MRIGLFIPCFVDHYFPEVGVSIVKVLEKLGHTVEYTEGQTCCGQPAFNSGYWDEARKVAEHMLDVFASSEVVVSASGSCGAMIKIFNPELFRDTGREADAKALSERTWEFSSFLVDKLGVTDVGASFPHKVTFHDGCHGLRELGIQSQPRQLLAKVKGVEFVEMDSVTCCGFGGTFAVKFPAISTAMGEVKCASVIQTGAEYVASNDSSCLMQIQGMLNRQTSKVKSIHLAEILASS